MNLISYAFILFFIISVLVYWLIPQRYRTAVLILCSLIFYMWSSPLLVIYPVSVSVISFLFGCLITGSDKHKKAMLMLGIIPIILLLLATKYLSYYLELFSSGTAVSIAVPLGISYFTLEGIGYLVDVYHCSDSRMNFFQLLSFFLFFPKILSGPICRAGYLIPQIFSGSDSVTCNISDGLIRMLLGLFKKAVIADNLARFVDLAYSSPLEVPGPALVICAVFYSLQLYFDFTGCMDIVTGAAGCFGITLPENFRTPYFSSSIKEFWSRWHITLSNWYRDYVYFPMGGNRKGSVRSMLNILTVFLLSGLWHGAGITFVLWGLWHGIFRCLETAFGKSNNNKQSKSGIVRSLFRKAGTFTVVTLGWILFRSSSISTFSKYVRSMAYNWNYTMLREWFFNCINSLFSGSVAYGKCILLLVLISLGIATALDIIQYKSEKRGTNNPCPLLRFTPTTKALIIILIIVLILTSGNFGSSGFIYYKFD